MTEHADANDFTGPLERGESSEQLTGSELEPSEDEDTTTGTMTGTTAATADNPEGDPGTSGEEYSDDRPQRKGLGRREYLAGAVVGGALLLGAGADVAADGKLDGDFSADTASNGGNGAGGAIVEDTPTPEPTEQPGAANTDTPAETPAETPTEAPTETPSQTSTPEPSYQGEIDGRGYQLAEIPGPVEGQGYIVDDEVLASYDPDGWRDIIDEEEYQALGTGTDWYVTRNAIIGINEEDRVSRTFPAETFNYDTGGLYEDIREDQQ